MLLLSYVLISTFTIQFTFLLFVFSFSPCPLLGRIYLERVPVEWSEPLQVSSLAWLRWPGRIKMTLSTLWSTVRKWLQKHRKRPSTLPGQYYHFLIESFAWMIALGYKLYHINKVIFHFNPPVISEKANFPWESQDGHLELKPFLRIDGN